jgi:hypothetical protein
MFIVHEPYRGFFTLIDGVGVPDEPPQQPEPKPAPVPTAPQPEPVTEPVA